MLHRLRLSLLLAAAIIVLPGCGLLHMWPWKKKAPGAVAKAPRLVGTVALVNEEDSFVLIDNGSLPSPSAGTVLKCNLTGTTSAEVRVTQIHKPPFVIADIIKGLPKKGDQVFQ